MTPVFTNRLSRELLLSEKKRTAILIIIFISVIIVRLIVHSILHLSGLFPEAATLSLIWLFPLSLLLFELLSFLYVSKKIRKGEPRIPLAHQYLNASFEILIPSVIMLVVAMEYPRLDMISSPAIMVYFLFIVLSTLRLDRYIPVYISALSSTATLILAILTRGEIYMEDIARAILLLSCGIAAGLVADQIKCGIYQSLEEAERRTRIENMFGQQISSEVAETLIASDGNINSRRSHVAVMFVDIRNFTQQVSGKSPEEIVRYQQVFFNTVITIVSSRRGIVHQFLGDGCMIVFGTPLELSNPCRNALDAAYDLLRELETNSSIDGRSIKVGIGVHTGEVVTGNIGNDRRQQYSITGTPVIIAARIEQLNKQFGSELLVSREVFEAAGERERNAVQRGNVALKGWNKPIEIVQLS